MVAMFIVSTGENKYFKTKIIALCQARAIFALDQYLRRNGDARTNI